MIWEQLISLLSIVSIFIALLVTGLCFSAYRTAAKRVHEREKRLPDATQFENLRIKIAETESLLQGYESEVQGARELIGFGKEIRGQIDELLSRRDGLRGEIAGIEKQVATLQREYNKKVGESVERLSVLDQNFMKAKRKAEREIEEHRDELKSSLRELEGEISRQKERVQQERRKQLYETQHEFDQQLTSLQIEFEHAKVGLQEKIDEANSLDQRLRELSTNVEQLQKSQSKLGGEVDGLKEQKLQLKQDIERLEKVWDRLLQQTGGGDDAERTSELWQPVIAPAEVAVKYSEEMCLEKVETYLKSCGLYFSRRMVYAFHTSLKVAEASPLAVLAGISGTGKSELPRRYAEAVGMNFLPLAVQPRWDSPQDMFGFFNYLENRFRATELGRALVQMDSHAGEAGRGWPSSIPDSHQNLSGQMLLVLLDEMNLARVEYYFSDFLSKLETRRGVDPNNPESRRKAELSLEIGRTGIGSPTMNVFVGPNVLFVGTMNEDETTQTLSDKVIDRSNLLRFGRPKTLSLENTGDTYARPSARLAASNWNDWLVPTEDMDHDRERTDEIIESLNEAMSIIRRPFAHRTSRAIRAYVANYPRIGEATFNCAMADQIEQKLLPKFRGLDPSDPEVRDALDRIRGVIEELEDAEFLEALRESRNGHQIAWSGVDRAIEGQAV
ncbi:Chromosome partition protein Smc [Rubripirellula lacrimiformis]|uniref:Chromosome partition protein Smc n=1 Tax=Rubripirellula lacrimiformis TaxID=1930273 RepID=A0A517NAT3_9BACT|nr:hypothetical protein [Rubripirellula lacrimiformis]QDT04239.1 Chromosome partition protein Smc [Rubripirellula lacrimiformis]